MSNLGLDAFTIDFTVTARIETHTRWRSRVEIKEGDRK